MRINHHDINRIRGAVTNAQSNIILKS
jgi:hypothetical protein